MIVWRMTATSALEGGAPLQEAIEELQAGGAQVTAHLERARKSVQRATGGLSDVDKEGFPQVKDSTAELKSAIEQFESSLEARRTKLRLP
jgi:exonuclease VII small subunit